MKDLPLSALRLLPFLERGEGQAERWRFLDYLMLI
jgi:hypothetical protein